MKKSALSRIRSFFETAGTQAKKPALTQAANIPTKETIAAILNTAKPGQVPMAERAAYTPKEFAALFGKHYTWAYRQIYAGKINVITDMGRMLIPREEIQHLRGKAHIYNG